MTAKHFNWQTPQSSDNLEKYLSFFFTPIQSNIICSETYDNIDVIDVVIITLCSLDRSLDGVPDPSSYQVDMSL